MLWIILVFIVFVFIFSYRETIKGEEEMRKLNNSRPYLSREEYIEILINKGYQKEHIGVVYDEIKEMLGLDFFSIYPEDDIYVVYGIDDLDDIELFDRISEKLELRKVEQKDCDLISDNFEIVNAEYILSIMNNLAKNI